MVKFQSLFDRGGLSLDRLRSFVLVAEAGGLSRAAGGDPSRMSLFSKQLRELETFFGVPLTRRQGKVVVLTDAGRRLGQVAELALRGVGDFQDACRRLPESIMLDASNSVLEWMVLPRLAKLRTALPNTLLEFHTGRTHDLVRRVSDMTVDLAIVRDDAVIPPLRSNRLFALAYALFVPKRFAWPTRQDRWRDALAGLPLASSAGGQFREHLQSAAAKAGWTLRIELSCASFTHAARAVHAGDFAAILPAIAAEDFEPAQVKQVTLPFLKSYTRPMSLAWNPRLTEVRPVVKKATELLAGLLG